MWSLIKKYVHQKYEIETFLELDLVSKFFLMHVYLNLLLDNFNVLDYHFQYVSICD